MVFCVTKPQEHLACAIMAAQEIAIFARALQDILQALPWGLGLHGLRPLSYLGLMAAGHDAMGPLAPMAASGLDTTRYRIPFLL